MKLSVSQEFFLSMTRCLIFIKIKLKYKHEENLEK